MAVNLNGKCLSGHHTSYAVGVNWYHCKSFHYLITDETMLESPGNC